MMTACPWDDCIYPSCNSRMGCVDDKHTIPLDNRALVVRHSFANPFWWGYHRFIWWEHQRRGRVH
jgi:hypothetical protein